MQLTYIAMSCIALIIISVIITMKKDSDYEAARKYRRVAFVVVPFLVLLVFFYSGLIETTGDTEAGTDGYSFVTETEKEVTNVEIFSLDEYVGLKDGYNGVAWTVGERPSELVSSGGYVYATENMGDYDLTTSWQEGVDGCGEGTTIELDLETAGVSAILIANGNLRDGSQSFYKNCRVAELAIADETGDCVYVSLEDEPNISVIHLQGFETSSVLYITINDAYADNADYEDTCIAEIMPLN